jgi:sporulation and cell division protein SsgA
MNQFSVEGMGSGPRRAYTVYRHTMVFTMLAPEWLFTDVDVDLRYDTSDPFAVTLSFCCGSDQWTDWIVSRDLLGEGMTARAGEGDIRIRPSEFEPNLVLLHLESPAGHADFSADRRQLQKFLDCTVGLVPYGYEAERLDIGSFISQVLAENNDWRSS